MFWSQKGIMGFLQALQPSKQLFTSSGTEWMRASSQQGKVQGQRRVLKKADLGLQVQPCSQARATAPVCS